VTIISIDFSILYPGVCICRDFKDFKWLAVVNTSTRKIDKDHFAYINANYPNLKIFSTSTRRKKDPQYHITERIKLENYLEAVDLLVAEIKKEILPEENIIVCLEGISFGSSGNSLVDISQATGILKRDIVKELLNGDLSKFFIFSPSELKNALGCKGNASKHDILAKFKTEPIIEETKKSDLFKLINQENWIIEKDKILSPIIDMVDAYLGVAKIYELSK
jgi:Holliday junction resolvasome RuvABC endonuclease subunit